MRARLLLGLIASIYIFAYLHFGFWRQTLHGGDTWGYYLHLPSALLYQDIGDYSSSIAAWRVHNPSEADPRDDKYGIRPAPTGKLANKYPLGVAVMEAPFFGVAHVWCLLSGQYSADGFSLPYSFSIGISTLFFAVWGLWLLLLALRPYFPDERMRLAVVAVVGLATNLFYSSTYTVGMSHPYLFFLYALLLLGVRKLYENPSLLRAVWVGGSAGMIALTRTPEVICLLIPLLWGIARWRDVPARFVFLWKHRALLVAAVLSFCAVLLPQAFYWKFVSGQWWWYGYQGEKFDWENPRILDGLFHFQNGWLIYTPVMAFSLLGLLWLRRRAADAWLPVLAYLPLHLFIIYSWWCWNYINGFGSRPMIEAYPLLAFPLAAFVQMMWDKKWTRALWLALSAFFIWLNLFQTWQVSRSLLLSEVGSQAYYQAIFGKTRLDFNAYLAFDSGESQPDDQLRLIKTLNVNEMEDSTEALFTREMRHTGQFGFRCDKEFSPGCYIESDTTDLRAGDWLRVSVFGFVRGNEAVFDRGRLARLVVHIFDKDGETLKYRSTGVSSQIGNRDPSIWHSCQPDVWGEARLFVKIPKGFKPGHRVKAYVWNPPRQPIFVDDLRVELWRRE